MPYYMIKNEKLVKCLKALKEDTYFKKFIEIAHGNDIVWGKLDKCWDNYESVCMIQRCFESNDIYNPFRHVFHLSVDNGNNTEEEKRELNHCDKLYQSFWIQHLLENSDNYSIIEFVKYLKEHDWYDKFIDLLRNGINIHVKRPCVFAKEPFNICFFNIELDDKEDETLINLFIDNWKRDKYIKDIFFKELKNHFPYFVDFLDKYNIKRDWFIIYKKYLEYLLDNGKSISLCSSDINDLRVVLIKNVFFMIGITTDDFEKMEYINQLFNKEFDK